MTEEEKRRKIFSKFFEKKLDKKMKKGRALLLIY
jgi:hypothetical protein